MQAIHVRDSQLTRFVTPTTRWRARLIFFESTLSWSNSFLISSMSKSAGKVRISTCNRQTTATTIDGLVLMMFRAAGNFWDKPPTHKRNKGSVTNYKTSKGGGWIIIINWQQWIQKRTVILELKIWSKKDNVTYWQRMYVSDLLYLIQSIRLNYNRINQGNVEEHL